VLFAADLPGSGALWGRGNALSVAFSVGHFRAVMAEFCVGDAPCFSFSGKSAESAGVAGLHEVLKPNLFHNLKTEHETILFDYRRFTDEYKSERDTPARRVPLSAHQRVTILRRV